jgi:hypothetical protein
VNDCARRDAELSRSATTPHPAIHYRRDRAVPKKASQSRATFIRQCHPALLNSDKATNSATLCRLVPKSPVSSLEIWAARAF